MRWLCTILLLPFFISCNKDEIVKPYSFLSIKYIDDVDYVFIETAEGSWDKNQKLAQLHATGYQNQIFNLFLPNLTDTGNYSNPSIKNIYFTDGLDFRPYQLKAGFIHISFIDSISVSGDFNVTLEDDFNGTETRTIVGRFGINIH